MQRTRIKICGITRPEDANAVVDAGADARDVAAAFNLVSNTTGVNATAITRTRIEHITGADTFTFTLQGKSTTESTVTFTISDVDDISAAKDAINAVSGSTGIIAKMVEGDLSKIDLVQDEGYDIIVGDVTASSTHTAGTVNTSAVGANAAFTLADHGFKVGDIVKEGDEVSVKVIGFDRGKVKLSIKEAS